jgi:hypothetical protein
MPLLLLLGATPALAVITNVQVTGTISLQAVLTYTAPDTNPCSLQVSESASLTSLVHDVDPTLFTGANSDGGGSVNRTWVIGRRKADMAADGKRYSRALQCNTKHYYRLTCGSDQVTGNFTTSNIPLGRTLSEAILIDRNNPGNYTFPDYDPNNRNNQTIIDPQTGVLLKPLTTPADDTDPTNPGFGWTASGGVEDCDPVMYGGFHCSFEANSGGLSMFWINPQTGEVRYLGRQSTAFIPDKGIDQADYTQGWNSSYGNNSFNLYNFTLSPNDQGVATGSQVPYTLNDFYPNIISDVAAFTAHDPIPFDPSQFGCGLAYKKTNQIVLNCLHNVQDSPGWSVTLDVSGGPNANPTVAAAVPVFGNPRSRWCGTYNAGNVGDIPIRREYAD